MGPKKGKKKTIDTRGFCTTSTIAAKPPAEKKIADKKEIEECSNDSIMMEYGMDKQTAEEAKVVAAENIVESPEVLEHRRQIGIETTYIQSLSTKSTLYTGQLCAQAKLDVQVNFNMPNSEVLDAVVEYSKKSNRIPLSYHCTSYNYERASRILRALEGVGVHLSLAYEALCAVQCKDERAAFEWALEHHPTQLSRWCEYGHLMEQPSITPLIYLDNTADAKVVDSQPEAEIDISVGGANLELDVGIVMRESANARNTPSTHALVVQQQPLTQQEMLQRAQEVEKAKHDTLRRAKALAFQIEQENEEAYYNSQSTSTALSDVLSMALEKMTKPAIENELLDSSDEDEYVSTKRYGKLASYLTTLQSSVKLLEKKELKTITTRIKLVREEMNNIRPNVDFKVLYGVKAKEKKGENGKEEDGEVTGGDEKDRCGHGGTSLSDAEGLTSEASERAINSSANEALAVHCAAASTVDVDEEQTLPNISVSSTVLAGVTNVVTMEEDEEIGLGMDMVNIFGDDDDGASSNLPSEEATPFEYIKSKTQPSPQKLLSEAISDTRTYSYRSEGANKWIEVVDIGPLSNLTAKQLSRPKGSFISAAPHIYCKDRNSARELTCLKLLFDITPRSGRVLIQSKLATCVVEVWSQWLEVEMATKQREVEDQAEHRVSLIQQCISNITCDKSDKNTNEATSSQPGLEQDIDKKSPFKRQGLSVHAIHQELRKRKKAGKLAALEEVRNELPATKASKAIVDMIESNEVTIICGETGCGKSTQVPQMLLRDDHKRDNGANNRKLNIIVTEPRRVAAVSVATRVGAELGDGDISTSLCGYTVRMDSRTGPMCVCEYVTIGVLLKRIQSTKGACLEGYSHVIVDEVHERSMDSDLLLLMLKRYKAVESPDAMTNAVDANDNDSGVVPSSNAVAQTHFPRVVLMSATADEQVISAYWSAVTPSVAVTHIPGRTFPVTSFFLEDAIEYTGYEGTPMATHHHDDYEFVGISKQENSLGVCVVDQNAEADVQPCAFIDATTAAKYSNRTHKVLTDMDMKTVNYDLLFEVIKKELLQAKANDRTVSKGNEVLDEISTNVSTGAILVFMSGLEEIKRVIQMVQADRQLSKLCVPVPMHSSLSSSELQQAFATVPLHMRKLVVSTNICETGVTIEDVDCVIDSGFVKSMSWNEVTEISRLRMHWCSVAETTQRRGRAGRVRAGKCIHLFPKLVCAPESTELDNVEAENRSRSIPRMRIRPDPEMKIAPLTSPILSLTDQGFGPSLLLDAIGCTVSTNRLENATQTLVELGAIVIDGAEEVTSSTNSFSDHKERTVLLCRYSVTPLGRVLAALPCDARSGKILLAARQLGCLKAAAVFVASLDSKNIFLRDQHSDVFFLSQYGKKSESDAVAVVNAYSEWSKVQGNKWKWSATNGISMTAMVQMAGVADELMNALDSYDQGVKHYEKQGGSDNNDRSRSGNTRDKGKKGKSVGSSSSQVASSSGPSVYPCITCRSGLGMHTCVTGPASNNAHELLHAAITAGSGNNVAYRVTSVGERHCFLSNSKSTSYARLSKSSLVAHPGEIITFCSQMQNTFGSHSIHNVMTVNAATMILFSPWAKFYLAEGTVLIGRGIGVKCKPQTLVALRKLKASWEELLLEHSDGCVWGKELIRLLTLVIHDDTRLIV